MATGARPMAAVRLRVDSSAELERIISKLSRADASARHEGHTRAFYGTGASSHGRRDSGTNACRYVGPTRGGGARKTNAMPITRKAYINAADHTREFGRRSITSRGRWDHTDADPCPAEAPASLHGYFAGQTSFLTSSRRTGVSRC